MKADPLWTQDSTQSQYDEVTNYAEFVFIIMLTFHKHKQILQVYPHLIFLETYRMFRSPHSNSLHS